MSYRLDQAVGELHNLARDIEAEVDARYDECSKFLQAAVSTLKRRIETDPAFAKSAAEPRKIAKTLPDSLDKLVPWLNPKIFSDFSQNVNPNDAKLPAVIVPSVAPPLPPKIPVSEEPSVTESFLPDHDFQSMKFNELKKLAKSRGIPIERETKKEQLVFRLREFFKKEFEKQQQSAGIKQEGTLRSEDLIAAKQQVQDSKSSSSVNASGIEDKKSEISSIVEIASQSMEDANEDDLQKRAKELEAMAIMAKKAQEDILREIQRKKDEAEKIRLEKERQQQLIEEKIRKEKEEADRLAREAAKQAEAEEAERKRKEQEYLAQQERIKAENEKRLREQQEEDERKRKEKEDQEKREAAAKAAKQKELEDERRRIEEDLNKKVRDQLQKAGIDSTQPSSASEVTLNLRKLIDSRGGNTVHASGDKNSQLPSASSSSSSSSSAAAATTTTATTGNGVPGAMLPSKLFNTPKFHIKGGGGGGNSSPATAARTMPPHMVSLLSGGGGNAGPSGYGVSPSTEPVVFRMPLPPQQQPQYYPSSAGKTKPPHQDVKFNNDFSNPSSPPPPPASSSNKKDKEYPLPEDPEFSGSDEDTDDGKIPTWAKGEELLRALKEQYEGKRDPHTIFPPMGVSEFPIDEIFRKRGNIRPRGSSAIWTRDGVTSEERLRYQEGSRQL